MRNAVFARQLVPLLLALSACATAPPQTAPGPTRAGVAADRAATDWRQRLLDPVSAPVTFESPIIETNVRPFYVYHELPNDSIFGGGDLRLAAVQARLALTERLAFIATKDGYFDLNSDDTPDEEGWADLAAGLKYAVIADPDSGLIVTPGFFIELSQGTRDVFQGNGDGLFRPFVSAGLDLDEVNLLGSFGFSLPFDHNEESTSFDYHLHLDYELSSRFAPLVELNGIHYTRDGDRVPFDFEGVDVANLGSSDVEGNDIITGAAGFRFRLLDSLQLGVTYEWPLTDREDIFDERLTTDLVWSPAFQVFD